MRYIAVISTILVIGGIVLVSGSLFMVPYTVREQVRVDRSKIWEDSNFVLLPTLNKTFALDSIFANTSIIEIDISSTGLVVLKIIRFGTDEVWFERETRKETTSFWTAPFEYGIWRFVIDNASPTQVNVTVKITEFYPKVTEYRNVTYYRSLLDPVYGINGIVAIIVGTGLSMTQLYRGSKDTKHDIDSTS